MRNLIITFSKKLFSKSGEEIRRLRQEFPWGDLQGMEHVCQLTNLIANSQLLKPFAGPILINVLI